MSSISQQPVGAPAPQQAVVVSSTSTNGQSFVNVDVCLKTGEIIETQRVGINSWTSAKELAFEVVKRLGKRHKFIQEESQQTGGLAVLDVTVGEANAAIWAQDRLMDVMDIRHEKAHVILDRDRFEGYAKRKVFVMQAAPTTGVPQPAAPTAAPAPAQPVAPQHSTAVVAAPATSTVADSPSNTTGPTQCSTLLERQETSEVAKPGLQRGVSSIISNAVRNHNTNTSNPSSDSIVAFANAGPKATNSAAVVAVPQHRPKAPSRRAASKKPVETEEERNARKSKNVERKTKPVEEEVVKPLTPKREGWGSKAAKFFSPSSYCADPDEILRKRRKLEAEKKKLAKAGGATTSGSNNQGETSNKENVVPAPVVVGAAVKKEKKQVKIKTEEEVDEVPAAVEEVSPPEEQAVQPPGFGTKGTDYFSPNYVSDPDALRRLMRKKQQQESTTTGGEEGSKADMSSEEDRERPVQPPGFGTKGTDYFSPNFVSDPDALRRQKKKEEADKKKQQQQQVQPEQPQQEEKNTEVEMKGRNSAVVAPTATRTAAAKPAVAGSGAEKTNPSTVPPGKNTTTGTPAFTKEGVNRALFTPDGVEIMSALDAELLEAADGAEEEGGAGRISGKQEAARSTTPETDRHFTNAFKNSVAKGVDPESKQNATASQINKGELARGAKSQQYFSSNYVSDPGRMTKEQAAKLLAQDNQSPYTRSRTSNLRFKSNFLTPEESAMALQQSKKNKSWMM